MISSLRAFWSSLWLGERFEPSRPLTEAEWVAKYGDRPFRIVRHGLRFAGGGYHAPEIEYRPGYERTIPTTERAMSVLRKPIPKGCPPAPTPESVQYVVHGYW